MGKSNEAEKAWLKAKELGFKKTKLDPLELKHPDYDEKWFKEECEKRMNLLGTPRGDSEFIP